MQSIERSNRRHGDGTDDTERSWCKARGRVGRVSVADFDGVADAFVQLLQRGRAENDLIGGVDGVAGQDRRCQRGVRASEDCGDGLAVDVDRREIDPGRGGDVGIVVQHRLALRGDRAVAVGRLERVVPIPPIERRTRYERTEAVAERERRDDAGSPDAAAARTTAEARSVR